MIASTAAYAFLVGKLQASDRLMQLVGGRVYQGAAPAGTHYPIVLMQPYGQPEDVYYNAKMRAATRVQVSVRVVAPADSLTAVEEAAQLVDDCLHGTGPDFTDRGYIAACVRTSETEQTELAEGRIWRYLGGVYELVLTAEKA